MSLGYFPIATYRTSSVTNGGTTTQAITQVRIENRTTLDTKNLAETIQADIGGQVSFIIKNTNKTPVPIPLPPPVNPNTT